METASPLLTSSKEVREMLKLRNTVNCIGAEYAAISRPARLRF
jgi:hypothetical protein